MRRDDGPGRPTLLVVACDPGDVDDLAGILWGHDPTAVEERTAPDGPVLVAGFGDRRSAVIASEDLDYRFTFELWSPDDDGLDGWRAHARPWRAGRFVVTPPWIDPGGTGDPRLRPGPGDLVVRIDPGRAFGGGTHATTRLALATLGGLDLGGHTVLDAGCGSGVLAIGAALLGARRVVALDVDPAAVEATAANAEVNGVADAVMARVADVADGGEPVDLVVANLPIPPLLDALPALTRRVRPGGALVTTGFLGDRLDDVERGAEGLDRRAVTELEGWALLHLVRTGP